MIFTGNKLHTVSWWYPASCLALYSHVCGCYHMARDFSASPTTKQAKFSDSRIQSQQSTQCRCGCCACDHDWCHLNADTSMHQERQLVIYTQSKNSFPISVYYWKYYFWDDVYYHPLSWLVVGMICGIGFTTVSTKHTNQNDSVFIPVPLSDSILCKKRRAGLV